MPACECGCGEDAGYYKTWNSPGRPAGSPKRFCLGHSLTSPKTVFEHNVSSGGPDECWPWIGRISTEGYGKVGTDQLAHRIAYERAHGPIPAGMCVLHSCDNPPCCNPAHLSLGTHVENMRDRDIKGRHRSVGRKLTLERAREIRARHATGGFTYAELAAEFGVHRMHVIRVVKHRAWPERQVAR